MTTEETIQRLDPASCVSFDFETELMGAGNLAPKPICVSLGKMSTLNEGEVDLALYANGDDDFWPVIEQLLRDKDTHLILHTACFDMTCLVAARPDLFPEVFQAYEDGRIHDTQIREKLLNLSSYGGIDMVDLPDGSTLRVTYRLMDLVKRYLGHDRSADKTEGDSWRMNYAMLDGKRSDEYPEEAIDYAIHDAEDTLRVAFEQDQRIRTVSGPASCSTETFHAGVDFALRLMTCWGIVIDPDERAKVEAMLAEELSPEKLDLLTTHKVIKPGKPPMPYKNGAKAHRDDCTDKKTCDCPPKMKAGTKEKLNTKVLQALVQDVCQRNGIEIKQTPSGGISTDASVMEDIAELDPILTQYQHRQKLQKLVTTELPRIADADLTRPVHPSYDVLKETGRTSSYDGGKVKFGEPWPSGNIQNVDPRVRPCYVPREGNVILVRDYSSLELVTLAEKLVKLFGQSKLADLINAGGDPHAYLGSQLALNLDNDFRESCQEENLTTPDQVYEAFVGLKSSDVEACRTFFGHWRKFAKPTGLGYPGGLGPVTFITYAKATYGVDCTLEQAKQMKEIWLRTYPEMEHYFEWINHNCQDPNSADKYAYVTPLGMYRAGATYCAAANGASLQSPAAEGAKLAVFNTARAAHDKTVKSCLLGTHPIWFIHDEIGVEIPEDRYMHERSCELGGIMEDAMSSIIHHVKVKTEPALMRRWDKKAEAVFDASGRLIPWEPKEN